MHLSDFDFKKVTDFARKGLDKARQYAEGLNELEIKVEEATNSDKWGPHGTLMQGMPRASQEHIRTNCEHCLSIQASQSNTAPDERSL